MDTLGKRISGMVTGFGGLLFAVKRGYTLYHLHGDHLGGALLTSPGYYIYGADRIRAIVR